MYELGFARIETAIRSAAATLEGQQESVIRKRTQDFWQEDVAHLIRPGARAAIEAHQAAGEPAVLLTSSSNYLGQMAVDALGMDGMLCNRFVVADGVYTGALVEPLCYGPGKVDHAQNFAAERGVELEACAFYTDSWSDLPVLDVVGRPVPVHPDPRLRREAIRRGWDIADWGALST